MPLEKTEVKYILISYIVILLLVLAINIEKIHEKIVNLDPILQFALLNLGLYFIFFFFIKGVASCKPLIKTFKGAFGSILGFMAIDLILPEYHVTTEGLQIGGVFGGSATDYFFGYIYNHFLGITGTALVIFVYFVTFTILFGIGSILIKNFIKEI